MWKIDGETKRYPTAAAAKRAAQRRYSRPLTWSDLGHGPDGRLYTRGRGAETDDPVTVRSVR